MVLTQALSQEHSALISAALRDGCQVRLCRSIEGGRVLPLRLSFSIMLLRPCGQENGGICCSSVQALQHEAISTVQALVDAFPNVHVPLMEQVRRSMWAVWLLPADLSCVMSSDR